MSKQRFELVPQNRWESLAWMTTASRYSFADWRAGAPLHFDEAEIERIETYFDRSSVTVILRGGQNPGLLDEVKLKAARWAETAVVLDGSHPVQPVSERARLAERASLFIDLPLVLYAISAMAFAAATNAAWSSVSARFGCPASADPVLRPLAIVIVVLLAPALVASAYFYFRPRFRPWRFASERFAHGYALALLLVMAVALSVEAGFRIAAFGASLGQVVGRCTGLAW